MPIATTNETIARGDISMYLSANDNALGALFGARIAAPLSSLTITMVTDALRWANYSGQNAITLRSTTNYLIWLIGVYGQQAQAIIDGGGGGSVIPPGGEVPTPITISGSDFATTTRWNYGPYAGKNLVVFSNGIARYLYYLTEWIYTSEGIEITIPGFDSSTLDYTLVITIVR